jgi:hypothetical protein
LIFDDSIAVKIILKNNLFSKPSKKIFFFNEGKKMIAIQSLFISWQELKTGEHFCNQTHP